MNREGEEGINLEEVVAIDTLTLIWLGHGGERHHLLLAVGSHADIIPGRVHTSVPSIAMEFFPFSSFQRLVGTPLHRKWKYHIAADNFYIGCAIPLVGQFASVGIGGTYYNSPPSRSIRNYTVCAID